jgi:hypothetical protein
MSIRCSAAMDNRVGIGSRSPYASSAGPLVFLVAVITSDSPTCLVLDVRTPGRSGLDLPAGMLSGDGIDGEGVSRVARRKRGPERQTS